MRMTDALQSVARERAPGQIRRWVDMPWPDNTDVGCSSLSKLLRLNVGDGMSPALIQIVPSNGRYYARMEKRRLPEPKSTVRTPLTTPKNSSLVRTEKTRPKFTIGTRIG